MKWTYAVMAIAMLVTGACAGNTTVTGLHSVKTMNVAIESMADITKDRALAGEITKEEACASEQYGRLAASIVDEAEIALTKRDLAGVPSYIAAASAALDGVSAEAQRLKADHCGGN